MIKCAAVTLNLVGVAVVALADEAPGVVKYGHDAQDGAASQASTVESAGDKRTQIGHSIMGDTVAIGSAFCYAVYTTMLEQKLGDDADIDMLSLFAFLGALQFTVTASFKQLATTLVTRCYCRTGLCVLMTMAPVGVIAVWLDLEPVPAVPPWPVVRLLVLNGVVSVLAQSACCVAVTDN